MNSALCHLHLVTKLLISHVLLAHRLILIANFRYFSKMFPPVTMTLTRDRDFELDLQDEPSCHARAEYI